MAVNHGGESSSLSRALEDEQEYQIKPNHAVAPSNKKFFKSKIDFSVQTNYMKQKGGVKQPLQPMEDHGTMSADSVS